MRAQSVPGVSMVPRRLAVPVHRMRLCIELPDQEFSAAMRPPTGTRVSSRTRMVPRRSGLSPATSSSTVRGMVRTLFMSGMDPPHSAQASPEVTILYPDRYW